MYSSHLLHVNITKYFTSLNWLAFGYLFLRLTMIESKALHVSTKNSKYMN